MKCLPLTWRGKYKRSVFENRVQVRIFAAMREDKIVEGLKMGLFDALTADEY